MVTGIMATIPTGRSHRIIPDLTDTMTQSRNFTRFRFVLYFCLLSANTVKAGDWDITPRLYLAEHFSDNISLDDENKESDLVTEITPGISIHGGGARVTADIDYQLQSLFFLRTKGADNIYNQLDARGNVELAKDTLFLDAWGNITQVLVNATDTISRNAVNASTNRTNSYSWSLSPYLQSHFGGYADGVFRYGYSQTRYGEGASNATINSFDVGLVSGRRGLSELSWIADYNYTDQQRDTTSDAVFENGEAQARYRITNRFGLIGTVGFANNDFETSRNNVNGGYWSAGGFWQPNRYLSLEAQKGTNLESAAIGLYPISRTSLLASYRNRTVGLNPGPTWQGSFNHYTRRTTWSASYSESTTTQQLQTVEGGGTVFLSIDPITGEVNPDPQPGDLTVEVPQAPVESLTNEVTEQKTARATFGMKLGKTSMRLNVFNIQRTFLTTLSEENTKGLSSSLNRRIAPRTDSTLSGTWQRINNTNDTGEESERDFWFVQGQLSRQLRRKLSASVAYTFTQQESDNGTNYSENRIKASLTAVF
jgi:uncharacterized protein (PEP-CTERM system associated)